MLWIANNIARHRRGLDTVGVALGGARGMRPSFTPGRLGQSLDNRAAARQQEREEVRKYSDGGHSGRGLSVQTTRAVEGVGAVQSLGGRMHVSTVRASRAHSTAAASESGSRAASDRQAKQDLASTMAMRAGLTTAERMRLNSQMKPRPSILAVVLENLGGTHVTATPMNRTARSARSGSPSLLDPSTARSYLSDDDDSDREELEHNSQQRQADATRAARALTSGTYARPAPTRGSRRSSDGSAQTETSGSSADSSAQLLRAAQAQKSGFIRVTPRLSRREQRRIQREERDAARVAGGARAGQVLAPPAKSFRADGTLLTSTMRDGGSSGAAGHSRGYSAVSGLTMEERKTGRAGGAVSTPSSVASSPRGSTYGRASSRRASSRRAMLATRRSRQSSMLHNIMRARSSVDDDDGTATGAGAGAGASPSGASPSGAASTGGGSQRSMAATVRARTRRII